ncbi:hypothetical protein PR202_ga00573 [Eleusine coracana subsp. coracana]|uniref:Uncharacterized protein n=1 Tax=Eleusine coracana subsp. coracana TaxID=191504 RepID=A0AAV5BG54_ELECO|nr:hypothetical protein PR202_ga00573 [Eleusine coracana subsp. coracana]
MVLLAASETRPWRPGSWTTIEGIVAARKNKQNDGEVEEELVFQPDEVKRMDYLHASLSAERYDSTLPSPSTTRRSWSDGFPGRETVLKNRHQSDNYATWAGMESIWANEDRWPCVARPERWSGTGAFGS